MNQYSKTIKIILSVIFILLLINNQAIAREGDLIKGDIEYAAGSKYGIGNGFSFKFDRKNVPSVCYYDHNRNVIKYAHVSKGRWNIETVSASGEKKEGMISSLAFDKANNPHIAFYGADNALKIAVKKKRWHIENVDTTKGSGLYCSMVITPGGDPVITYQSSAGTMIAGKTAGKWINEKIDQSGGKTKVLQDGDGKILVYYAGYSEDAPQKEPEDKKADSTGKKEKEEVKSGPAKPITGQPILKHAVKQAGEWKISSISNSKGLTDFDVALDKNDSPTITYIRDKKIKIYRETLPGSAIWKEYQVGSEDCFRLSVAIKKNNMPSITYIADKKEELKFARFDGTKWDVKMVASAKKGYSFLECQIIEDKKDRDLIVLYDSDSLHLLLKRGEGWGLGRIDGKSKTGGYINLGVGSDGNPQVCYYDYTKKELHYTKEEKNQWETEVIDSTGDVGQFASMTLDNKNRPHVAYYDAMRGDLKYAWKRGKYWRWERVDHGKDTGVNISISMLRNKIPCIAYKNKTSRYLKFAYKRGKKWHRERVVKLGEYGGENVLLISPSGEIKVVYIDGYKAKKAARGESPVKNFIRIATRVDNNKWAIQELVGPNAAGIRNSGLSGDVNKSGDVAVSYIDRDGKLSLIRTEKGEWMMETFDHICWENTSIRFQKDGTLGILFLAGKTRKEAGLKMVSYKDGNWKEYRVEFPSNKVRFLSLASSPDERLRFACLDFYDYILMYFTEK